MTKFWHKSQFGGVKKILSGKKFPENVRALTLLAEELLRPVLKGHSFGSMTELQAVLLIISTKSRTAKLWIWLNHSTKAQTYPKYGNYYGCIKEASAGR